MGSTKKVFGQGSERTVTIRQVAERAGVHPGTVSRALQGDERVAPATLQHIQRIAEEMKYSPNIAARVLASGKTETIAIVTGPSNEHHYGRIIYYLGKELAANRYKRLVLNHWEMQQNLLTLLNTNSVDGVIAIDAFPWIDELVRSADDHVLPCVYAGVSNVNWTIRKAIDLVKVDLSQGVAQAVQAMLEDGCQRIAYLANDENTASLNEVRANVYSATLTQAGRKTEIINFNLKYEDIHDLLPENLNAYVAANGCPDGLLCQNDEIAIRAHRTLRELGESVPANLRIVGCDGLPYGECLTPPISTIEQPAERMCSIAWQFLWRRINDPSLPQQQATLEAQFRKRF
jgi:DNA-binding LacI/PurR family transcriptional regulator